LVLSQLRHGPAAMEDEVPKLSSAGAELAACDHSRSIRPARALIDG